MRCDALLKQDYRSWYEFLRQFRGQEIITIMNFTKMQNIQKTNVDKTRA